MANYPLVFFINLFSIYYNIYLFIKINFLQILLFIYLATQHILIFKIYRLIV